MTNHLGYVPGPDDEPLDELTPDPVSNEEGSPDPGFEQDDYSEDPS